MSTSDDELVFLPYLSPPKTDVTSISSLLQIRIWIIMWDKKEATNLPGGDGTVSLTKSRLLMKLIFFRCVHFFLLVCLIAAKI